MENRPTGHEAAPKNLRDSDQYLTELDRRRTAAHRLEPLEHGPVDPWIDRPRPALAPDSLLAAVLTLAPVGLIPLAPIDDFRAAWRLAETDAERAAIRHVVAVITGSPRMEGAA